MHAAAHSRTELNTEKQSEKISETRFYCFFLDIFLNQRLAPNFHCVLMSEGSKIWTHKLTRLNHPCSQMNNWISFWYVGLCRLIWSIYETLTHSPIRMHNRWNSNQGLSYFVPSSNSLGPTVAEPYHFISYKIMNSVEGWQQICLNV